MRTGTRHVRIAAMAAFALLAVSCGASTEDGSSELTADSVPVAPGASDSTTVLSADTGSAAAPVASDQPTDAADSTLETAALETDDTAAQVANAAPTTAELGGRAIASELRPEADFAANLLPDLAVDDVSRRSKINIRNVFPADRPVLFWMWAPH